MGEKLPQHDVDSNSGPPNYWAVDLTTFPLTLPKHAIVSL